MILDISLRTTSRTDLHIRQSVAPTNLTGFSKKPLETTYTKDTQKFFGSCQKIARVASCMLSKLISGWAYNRDKNAFCRNFGQKRGVGVLSSEVGISET